MTATRITVDGITYRVLVEYDSLKRSFELMEGGNAGTAITGRSIRDILGTVYTYDMTVRADPNYPIDYDNFYYKISEPVDYHFVVLPFGQAVIRFHAKITDGNDIYKGYYKTNKHWDELELRFDSMAPQRINVEEDVTSSDIDIVTPPITSLPVTFYSDYIFSDHEMIENSAILSNPSAMRVGSDWNVECSTGAITITGGFADGESTILNLSLRVPIKTINLSTDPAYDDYEQAIPTCDVDVASPVFSSLPQTFYSKYITEEMELIENSVILSNPSAIYSDWSVTCYNGYLTVSGTITSGVSTSLQMSLRKPAMNVTLSDTQDTNMVSETVSSFNIDITTPTITSLPATFYSRYITSDLEMIENSVILSNPSAMSNDWHLACYDGYLVITGSLFPEQTTTLKASLRMPRRQVLVATAL